MDMDMLQTSSFQLVRALAASFVVAGALASPPAAPAATPLTTEQVATGLARPIFATHAPGDSDRLYIVEQRGTIRILDISGGTPALGATFLDIQARVNDGGNEQGLLGLAFHPDHQSNGFFYVYYTDSGDDARLSRFSLAGGDPDDADETSEVILLTIPQPQTNHNGGWLGFGPNDGYLYVASGDGGGGGDDDAGHTAGVGNAQDVTDNLLGKLLRIDVDGSNGPGGLYGIPADNPFVGVPGDDEIWSYGLRNPWRNAFDRDTGDLYIADVGQGSWEEVDYQPWTSDGGESWGWRCREGAHDFNFSGGCAAVTHSEPIAEYSHGGSPFRCSITGGEVYRGCAIPDLRGSYFYADYCSDQIWSLVVAGGAATQQQDRTSELDPPGALTINNISSFGSDADGEIYVIDLDGDVYQIVPDGPAGACSPTPVPAGSGGQRALLALALLLTAAGFRGMGPCLRGPDRGGQGSRAGSPALKLARWSR
jgi:glucose/arabinose dehydrogenase